MRVVALLALVGCGRIGFDAHSGDATMTGDGGVPISLELPSGGELDRIAIAPDGTWYAVGVAGTVFRSDDHMTWTACGQFAATGLAFEGTSIYASGTDVKVSTDRCATWQTTGAPRYSQNVAISPSPTVLALADNGLYSYAGSVWGRITTPLDGNPFEAFAQAPGTWLAVSRAGLIHSTDGINWTSVVTGFATTDLRNVVAGTSHAYVISQALGMSSGGVSCSTNAGTSWSVCYGVGGYGLAVDPANDSHVLAGIYDNLVETTDAFTTSAAGKRGGAMGDSIVRDLAFQPDSSIVAATDSGVYYAAPGTLTWEARKTGLQSWNIFDIARTDTGELYLATEGGVIHGASATGYVDSFAGMSDNNDVNAILVTPDGSVIAVGRHVWLSTDGGTAWVEAQQLGATDQYRAYSILLDGTHVYVGTSAQIYTADPPYTSWTAHPVGHDVFGMVISGNMLWLATEAGLYTSADQAATFQAAPSLGVPVLTSIAELSDGELVVGDFAGGVWISSGGRQTWQNRGPANHPVRTVAVANDVIFAGTPNGVFASHDRGTWTVAPSTTALDVRSAIVDPADGQLVIGTIGHGLVKTAIP